MSRAQGGRHVGFSYVCAAPPPLIMATVQPTREGGEGRMEGEDEESTEIILEDQQGAPQSIPDYDATRQYGEERGLRRNRRSARQGSTQGRAERWSAE